METDLSDLIQLSKLLKQTLDEEESVGRSETSVFENTINRMNLYREKSNQKLELLRQQKNQEELSSMSGHPQINENSRKYSQNYIPIHKRVDRLMKTRNENLKTLKLESEMQKRAEEESVCTFFPKTNHKNPVKKVNFPQKVSVWIAKNQLDREKRLQERIQIEKESVKDKPNILEKSKKLAEKRSSTPLINRLQQSKPKSENTETSPFRPALCKNSVKMTENRSGNVHERLYDLRKGKTNVNLVDCPNAFKSLFGESLTSRSNF